MPLTRLVLILAIVIAAAGGTIWLARLVIPSAQPEGLNWMIVIPAALAVYVIWRVIAGWIRN